MNGVVDPHPAPGVWGAGDCGSRKTPVALWRPGSAAPRGGSKLCPGSPPFLPLLTPPPSLRSGLPFSSLPSPRGVPCQPRANFLQQRPIPAPFSIPGAFRFDSQLSVHHPPTNMGAPALPPETRELPTLPAQTQGSPTLPAGPASPGRRLRLKCDPFGRLASLPPGLPPRSRDLTRP